MSKCWNIKENKRVLSCEMPRDVREDIEMSGFYVSDIVKYSADENGALEIVHHTVFPSLRRRPNDTHASYQCDIPFVYLTIDGERAGEVVDEFSLDGTLLVRSHVGTLEVERVCYPSCEHAATYEKITVTNGTGESVALGTSLGGKAVKVAEEMGCMAINVIEVSDTLGGEITLGARDSVSFGIVITGRAVNKPRDFDDIDAELENRRDRIKKYTSPIVLECGSEVLESMFAFAKIRASESVFKTRSGLVHSPGGGNYYAAVWCNDQVEYSGTFFCYTGNPILMEAAYNAYEWYTAFMSDSFEPIPSSIIAEGFDFWNDRRDRGDAAMYLYGASYYLLTSGDRELAHKLWGAVKWCSEYCERQKNKFGVIASDTDELEERLPSGDANLSTSCLCYGGWRLAARLARQMGESDTAARFDSLADELCANIEKFFGANIHGYNTYRYYDGNTVLRSWICLPLCFGIDTRVRDTADALMSPYLRCNGGILSAEGEEILWDRSTLYALRGFFAAGEMDKAYDMLLDYSENRLLGDRVPYAVEAYPEYGMRHLSGESSLYCKIFLDGILGIVPNGFSSFELCPRLPKKLEKFALRNIHAFGKVFDIELDGCGARVKLADGTLVYSGDIGKRAVVEF